jgi:hypothetical protein
MKELEYLDRLSQDLIDNLEKQKKLIPEEDVLVNAIYLNVRETLLSQVLEHKESNPGLSSYLEVLAKKVLDTVSLSSKSYKTEKIKIKGKIEILESILSQTSEKRNNYFESKSLDKSISEKKDRKEKDTRQIGDRPTSIKEKRK